MSAVDTQRGRIVLTLAHVAGMIDMVALPLWIGTLIQHYGFSAPQAGLTVTVFLAAVAATSLWLARHFRRLPHWAKAYAGFGLALLAFLFAALAPVSVTGLPAMVALHAMAGVGVGGALSLTHGQIGRSENPHRLFAIVNIALGMFAIVFLAGVPHLIAAFGPRALFCVFAATMGVASVMALVAFPQADDVGTGASRTAAPLPRTVYPVVATVVCLTFNQAMVFSFVERVGADRGFGMDRVHGVLIAIGLVNLIPGALAVLLQKRFSPLAVGMLGPVLQAVLAVILSGALAFMPYAVASALYVATVIFTHTFLFGLLTRLDPSGRTVAATPAMMMLGSCAGPAVGGVLVHLLGYPGLGWAACAVSAVGLLCMLLASAQLRQRSASAQAALAGEAL